MIDGATRLLAIVGDPVAHVRSPLVINALLAKAGCNAVLVPWHIAPLHFSSAMNGLMRTENLDGIIITYPFKERALALAAEVGVMGTRIGAVNALRPETNGRWTADMFDGLGLIGALKQHGQSCPGRNVVLIGAGGAGSAIAFALADAGVASLLIHDRDPRRASALAGKVAACHPRTLVRSGEADLGSADLLINATPVGLHSGDGLPVKLTGLKREITVVDIVPSSKPTPLLKRARKTGCACIPGRAMVEGQAEALLAFFGIDVGAQEKRAQEKRKSSRRSVAVQQADR